jgi:hypothetical protein
LYLVAAAVIYLAPADEVAEPVAPANDEFPQRLAAASLRAATRRALVDELIAGRRRLADVAARFKALNSGCSARFEAVRRWPEATDGERYSRDVILFVETMLPDADPGRSAVLARLDAELAEVIATGGQLPAADE